MKEQDKELLLKDLSTRLPYGIMVLEDINKEFDGGCVSELVTITEIKGERMFLSKNSLTPVTIEEIRPYLRSMSSMTEEEKKKYKHFVAFSGSPDGAANFIDWLNAHHFDYRELIEKNLAIEAPKAMYNLKEK